MTQVFVKSALGRIVASCPPPPPFPVGRAGGPKTGMGQQRGRSAEGKATEGKGRVIAVLFLPHSDNGSHNSWPATLCAPPARPGPRALSLCVSISPSRPSRVRPFPPPPSPPGPSGPDPAQPSPALRLATLSRGPWGSGSPDSWAPGHPWGRGGSQGAGTEGSVETPRMLMHRGSHRNGGGGLKPGHVVCGPSPSIWNILTPCNFP